MRILHVINGLETGGAETVLYRLTTYRSDVEHEVVSLEGRGPYSALLEARGVRVHHLNWKSPLASLRELNRLCRVVKHSRADVVQAWMYRSNLLAGIAGRAARVPVVWNIRSSSLGPLRMATRLLARAGGSLAGWLPKSVVNCSSRSVELHVPLGYASAGSVIIPNGYDAGEFRPDEEARVRARDELDVGSGTFLMGTIARWHKAKGFPVLLRALELARKKGVPIRMVLVGRGIDADNTELVELIRKHELGDAVLLLGERADISNLSRAFDLHVLASISEGFPNVIAETMLSGTPNVATDVGDAKAIVGETGWIAPPGAPDNLAAAIGEAYEEWKRAPARWRKRREAARRRVAENFSLGAMVKAYEDLWTQVAVETTESEEPSKKSEKPLTVLHVINNLGLGGAETLLYRMATRGSATKHVVVSMASPAWYSPLLEKKRVTLHHLAVDSPLQAANGAIRLNRIIRESNADVVQCWMYRSNLFGGVVAKVARKPVVWGIHCSSLEPLRRGSRALARLGGILARTTPDYVINCSTRSAEIHAPLGYSAASVAVVHNGYEETAFFPDEEIRLSTRKSLGLGPEDFAVGSIARWHRQKDIPNFLNAVSIVRQRGISLRCILLGAGLESDNPLLAAEIERFALADVVILLGPRSDVQNVARALDLHVLASGGGEAFPNVVAETMLSGTPNAVTDVGDMPLMVGNSGWIVPPRNPEQLADAIAEAYAERTEHPEYWAARRRASRQQIAGNFSFDQMVEGYERIWNEVTAGRTA
jgi:glycosyltransferase involved in cell wall biosynthesis